MGIGFMPYVYMNEILGRSVLAPRAFGSQAPDSGNAEILWQFGSDEQKAKWLKPLVNGDIRSCFSMTEPEVSGADPTGLQTRAARDGDDWVINGHKWFTSGAIGAQFAIVMCVSDPDAEAHRRNSQIIVPLDTPGVDIVRSVPVMGETRGNHCEIMYRDVRVPDHQHPRPPRRRLHDRPEAPRARPHPPLHALARPDAARLRPHVQARPRARRLRAAPSPRSRPSRTGSPIPSPISRPRACSPSTPHTKSTRATRPASRSR